MVFWRLNGAIVIFLPDLRRPKCQIFSVDAKRRQKRWRDGRDRLGESFFLPDLFRTRDLLPGYSNRGDSVV